MNRTIPAILAFTLFMVAAWSLAACDTVASSRVRFTPAAAATSPPTGSSRDSASFSGYSIESDRLLPPLDAPDAEEQHLDLYGNDVTDAVAKYKSDRAGGVYQEHSPHTEVPRLKNATT